MSIRGGMRALSSVVLVGALLVALATSAVAAEDSDKGEKAAKTAKGQVTICHRTNSDKHPYVEISVGTTGVLKGHAAHHAAKVVWGPKLKAQHERWGDIIPAFDVGSTHFDGLNLETDGGASGDTSGQSILDAHCKVAGAGTI